MSDKDTFLIEIQILVKSKVFQVSTQLRKKLIKKTDDYTKGSNYEVAVSISKIYLIPNIGMDNFPELKQYAKVQLFCSRSHKT